MTTAPKRLHSALKLAQTSSCSNPGNLDRTSLGVICPSIWIAGGHAVGIKMTPHKAGSKSDH